MSPLKQILVACIIGPLIAFGVIALIDRMDNLEPKSHYVSPPEKEYVMGYINNEFVKLQIVKQ